MTGWGGRWSVDHRVGRRGLWVAVLLLTLFVLWTAIVRLGITDGSRNSVWIVRPFGEWPSTVEEVSGTSDIQLSVFAAYDAEPSDAGPDDPVPAMVGRPTLGTTVDSGDSNSINGSRFVTGIRAGAVTSLSIYVAAPVDRAPNDQFELAIYDDERGAPHAVLAVSERGTLRADAWNAVAIDANLEPHTAYWFMYNTNGTTDGLNNTVYATVPAAPLDDLIRSTMPSTRTAADGTPDRAARWAVAHHTRPGRAGGVHRETAMVDRDRRAGGLRRESPRRAGPAHDRVRTVR